LESGPVARFGRVEVEGSRQMDPDFIAFVADIPSGQPYSTKVLERSKKRLSEIEALASVSLLPAKVPDADGSVPIIIAISERKSKVVGAGASWSSTDGAKLNAYWKHRNLFGHGEMFRVDAGIGRLAQTTDYRDLDANFGVLLSQPGFFGPATRFDTSLKALQEHPEAYRRRAVIARAINIYKYSPELEFSGGVVGEYSDIDDAVGSEQFGLFSLPLTAVYDSRDDRLNPAKGIRARAGVEPTVDVLNNTQFVKLEASLATYLAIDDAQRFILAGRAGAGAIVGAQRDEIPADRRFLAGGGGSVRGYGYKNIGAGRLNGDAVAGRSLVEGSVELRTQWTDTIGAVLFADAGFVGDDPGFADIGDLKVGVGAGLRYFTAVGPIRVDVAVPVDPDQDDPDFAFYVGIGQAF
jgi:translocation and assembly module TamA